MTTWLFTMGAVFGGGGDLNELKTCLKSDRVRKLLGCLLHIFG